MSPPPGYNYYSQYVIETADKGFLVTGQKGDSQNTDADGCLVKTDSVGNVQWIKTVGGNNFDAFYSSVQLPDQSYLSIGWTRSFGFGNNFNHDGYLVKTDSAGNFLWQKTIGTIDEENYMGISKTSDGNFLLAGGKYYYSTDTLEPQIIKIDTAGNIIWTRTYSTTHYCELWWARECPDGSIVAVGSKSHPLNGQIDDGWIIKTDSAGNKQWERQFRQSTQHCYFRDVQPTTDGGYIAAGFAFKGASNTQDAWLVKLDSLGCDSVGCATYVTGIAPSPLERAGVRLFPNPAKEYVTISFLHSVFTACRVRIIDIMGKEVYRQSLFIQKQISLPVSTFASGIYVVELNYEGRKEYQKFVKE
jgi:hypothetical protein